MQEAYVAGVSTRKVDQVVESLGLRISKSEVSRICQGPDEQVDASGSGRSKDATRTCARRQGGKGARRWPCRAQMLGARLRGARILLSRGDRA